MDVRPGRGQARPRHDNDLVVGTYFYGINCPHCSEVSPLIENVTDNLHGGRIRMVATDDRWETTLMKHDGLSSQLSTPVRESIRDEIIEVTPTIIWSDDLVTKGAPYEDSEMNRDETAEYLSIRATKCYLKEANPGMSLGEIDEIIEQVFEGRMVRQRTEDGIERDPYKGVREITWRF